MRWRDVKSLVDSVYSEPVGAEVIVEALLASENVDDFFALVSAADDAAMKMYSIVSPDEDGAA